MASATKTCRLCGKEQPLTAFRSRGGSEKHLLKSSCNRCLYKSHRRWVRENQHRVREYRNKDIWTLAKRCARRGISPEQLVDQFDAQEHRCAICAKEISLADSTIDHNHNTGDFRGVLCQKCNRGLGSFGDSPTVLAAALKYLKERGSYGD